MQHQLQAEDGGLLGVLCPGKKKLLGKTFYLDNVKKRPTALILETISFLGGGVESFLHKDVSFVVTGSQEYLKQQKCTDTKAAEKGSNDGAQHAAKTREGVLSKEKQRPAPPRPMVCESRGKALLEKAIRNNELHKSSVLASAQSWGVKILYVDDILLYLKWLTRERFSVTHKRPEKTSSKQGSHVVRAAALKSPYLKIEDVSRKYKPLHMQSLTFPSLWYPGRFSPFEPPPPEFEKRSKPAETKTRDKKKPKNCAEDRPAPPLSCGPSPPRPRKKDLSYCECCHQQYSNLEEHLQSDQHRAFVLDVSNYAAVDRLVAEMVLGFSPEPPTRSEDTHTRPLSPTPIQDACELEPVGDLEAEREVRALRRRGSSLCDGVSGPRRGTRASRPAGPSSPDRPPALPKPPVLSPGVRPLTGDQVTGPSSPVMPVLAVEAHDCQLRDTRHAFPSSDVPCPALDPYSQPPVLSPQVPYVAEPHSPYSEPPVLSPKQTLGERETDAAEPPFQRRSRSLPQQSAVAPNPKKRCRSASPGRNRAKRRRRAGHCTDPLEPGSHPLANAEARLSGKGFSEGKQCPHPGCAAEAPALNQAVATFPVPSAQTCGLALNPADASVHSASLCIEPGLIPDLALLSSPSSDSDWDREVLSGMGQTPVAPPARPDQDKDLLHSPCAWLRDSSYESRLHTALQPRGKPLCGEDMDSSAFSRTVVKIVEV